MRRRMVLATVVLVLGTAACTAGTPDTADPRASLPAYWAAEFDRFLAGPLNDFEQGVLEDYRITDAEYAAARDGFRTCVEEEGYEVDLLADGFSVGAGPALRASLSEAEQVEGADAVVAACEHGWTEKVGFLYESLRDPGPDPGAVLDEMRACLERNDLPGADLDDDGLQRLVAELSEGPSAEQVDACLADPGNG